MKKALLNSFAALLAGAGLSFAQEVAEDRAPAEMAGAVKDAPSDLAAELDRPNLAQPELVPGCPGGHCWDACACCEPCHRFYGSAEYLLWWMKGSPVPPLVTRTPLAVFERQALPGVPGQPGTRIVLGGDDLNTGMRSGGRFTLGGYLDGQGTVALEGSYFFLGRDSTTAGVVGDPSALFGIPFIDTQGLTAFAVAPGTETVLAINIPGITTGRSTVTVSNFLQGAEANGIWNISQAAHLRLGLLGGFRFLNLNEALTFASQVEGVPGGQVSGLSVSVRDQFGTENRFYGGQLGLRAEMTCGRFFVNGTGKVALGSMRQVVEITGVSTGEFPAGIPNISGTFPGGIFSQPTNIGRHTHSEFAVVPEVTVNAGINVTRNLSAFVGYNFLYANQVLRAGDQIDPNINLSQSPVIVGGTGLVGPAVPAVRFSQSDFWAQGINFGFQVRY